MFSFKCGTKYCAKNKSKCEEFLNKSYNMKEIDVGDCGNDMTIVYGKVNFEKHQRLDFLF
jgi:hypothetical protein